MLRESIAKKREGAPSNCYRMRRSMSAGGQPFVSGSGPAATEGRATAVLCEVDMPKGETRRDSPHSISKSPRELLRARRFLRIRPEGASGRPWGGKAGATEPRDHHYD